MKKVELISIVIPVYNVELYIGKCIESILSQTYQNIEIILVNDGSKDNSGKICDEYGLKDTRVKVFHKENEGLMATWKYGVQKASGAYIGFVDSDDWIDNDMYHILYKEIVEKNTDMVICGLVREFSNGKQAIVPGYIKGGYYNKDRMIKEIYPGLINTGHNLTRCISMNRVTKLFKTELLKRSLKYLPDEISLGEDLITCFVYILGAKSIVIMEDYYPYHYRNNCDSMTEKFNTMCYERNKMLTNKLIELEKLDGYNFKNQIANDFIANTIIIMEQEVLRSNRTMSEMIESIKKEYKSVEFLRSIKESDTKDFSVKFKIYLLFLKGNRARLFIYVRKIINFIKNKYTS